MGAKIRKFENVEISNLKMWECQNLKIWEFEDIDFAFYNKVTSR